MDAYAETDPEALVREGAETDVDPDEQNPHDNGEWYPEWDPETCSCTWGAYAKYAGGTGCNIVKYDPNCPEHFPEDEA